ncbi:hypothetical protein COR50_14150 [Chitinophaga caeni]|uniref:RHS repeat-associated core domain-containing protein n=1 Tax=Chitinophaga caeni TaxID=2029983 RepID=A0A291QWH9_9BACT|nr:RHS repeat-associated core domain-containing protein [Chitinophaga caeni]ATL48213.1 hypothetical protein COR50_14150 [Chitinophaga caeni]
MDLSTTFDIDTSWLSEGRRTYELTNHLGNVLATISDKRIPVFENEGMTVAYYDVDLLSAVDYYPFGMQMPGREFNGGGYRYGFNGKENDNEVKGEGNQQDYGMRVYDPRLGRFLSVDPLSPDYPELTPYQYANNSPVTNIDVDGLEDANSNVVTATKRGKAALKKVTDHVLKEQAKKAAEKMAAESAKRMAEEAAKKVGSPKSSTLIGLALSIVMELFTSPNDQHTADELYKGINPKNDPVVDRKDLPGWDSEMERQGHFMGLPLKEDVTKDEEKKNVYIHYSDRKSIVEIAGTRVLIPNKKIRFI